MRCNLSTLKAPTHQISHLAHTFEATRYPCSLFPRSRYIQTPWFGRSPASYIHIEHATIHLFRAILSARKMENLVIVSTSYLLSQSWPSLTFHCFGRLRTWLTRRLTRRSSMLTRCSLQTSLITQYNTKEWYELCKQRQPWSTIFSINVLEMSDLVRCIHSPSFSRWATR